MEDLNIDNEGGNRSNFCEQEHPTMTTECLDQRSLTVDRGIVATKAKPPLLQDFDRYKSDTIVIEYLTTST